MPTTQTLSVPVAHIDDDAAVQQVLSAEDLHGGDYTFHIGQWNGETTLRAAPSRSELLLLIETTQASIQLQSGDLVRGPDPLPAVSAARERMGQRQRRTRRSAVAGRHG
ncbi:MAG: hypothetical protein R2911_14540 [Caldilineaceae bacterium]